MRLMDWSAYYLDGTMLKETENEFTEIDKEKLKEFRLEGLGLYFKHDVDTGEFRINQNVVQLFLNEKPLGKTKDILTFKQKREVLNSDKSGIIGYYIGFREENVRALFWVDALNSKIKFLLKVPPSTYRFNMVINGNPNERVLECSGEEKEFLFEL
jgi:hypothetical protein